MTKRIGWFTTGRGPGSLGLFSTMRSKIRNGEIDARLSFIFLNREEKGNKFRAKLISMAEEDGVPVIILPSDGFRPDLKQKDLADWRAAYGQALRERITPFPMDFGVLAGYMLILDPGTCERFRIINLHPALPGTYQGTWEDIVRRVAEGDDRTYGAMIHLCTPELDRGATISYDEFDISDLRAAFDSKEELAKAIRAREAEREVPLLMVTIKMLVEGKIGIGNDTSFGAGGDVVRQGAYLADEIERTIKIRRKG